LETPAGVSLRSSVLSYQTWLPGQVVQTRWHAPQRPGLPLSPT